MITWFQDVFFGYVGFDIPSVKGNQKRISLLYSVVNAQKTRLSFWRSLHYEHACEPRGTLLLVL